VWAALDELRDPRSLPAILAAWIPGQRQAACLYARIHYLAGLTGPQPEGIARDVEEEARYRKELLAFYAAHPRAIWPKTRRNATCRACGRTGEYERAVPALLEAVLPNRGAQARQRLLDENCVMVCKFCGARNAGALEPMSPSPAPGAVVTAFEGEDDDGGPGEN
jgi:hypothetical protein